MKISVVMTTYNGEKYIEEQLSSLKNQTRIPEEVLIFDDCSTDNTVEIVRKFIKENQLKNYRLIENEKNKGWRRNFMEGFAEAQGDIIFPCDQDDIWFKDKIANMEKIMEENENILLLTSKYELLYADDHAPRISAIFPETKENAVLQKPDLKHKWMHIRGIGSVFAFRRKLLEMAQNIWCEEMAHDVCLWEAAYLSGGLYFYNRPTIFYRRHDKNASGFATYGRRKNRDIICSYLKMLDNEREELGRQGNGDWDRELNRQNTFWQLRLRVNEERDIIAWFRLLGYLNYFRRKRNILSDLYSAFLRE